MDLADRMDRLFAAFSDGDVDAARSLLSPAVRTKQNIAEETDLDGLLAFVGGVATLGLTVSYSDVRRTFAEDTVVEQHLVTLTKPDGGSVSSDVCVVVRFGPDGLITRLDEYVDSAAFAPAFE